MTNHTPPTARPHRRRATITALITAGLLAAILTPGVATADEVRDGQWYLDTLGIHEAHELSQGAGVTIGVIDTGIDAEHSDLQGKISALNGDADLNDDFDHGTRVASVAVGHSDAEGVLGIAPEATVVSANVFASGEPNADVDAVVEAIYEMTDAGVDVISMSIGGSGQVGTSSAIKYANERGVAVVVPTGNKVQETERGLEEQTGSGWASHTGTVPVTGIDKNEDFWDNSLDLSGAAPQPQLGLAAPSVDIPVATANGGYETRDGLSYAAPIVAGTLALIKSAYPDLSIQQLNERLLLTTDDKGPEGYDYEYGWGIVNPLAALTEEVEHYEGPASGPDDRLPLEEQGQQTGDDGQAPDDNGDDPAETDDDQALIAVNTGLPLWVWITIATATTVLTAAVATTLLLRRRNRNKATAANGPVSQVGNHPHIEPPTSIPSSSRVTNHPSGSNNPPPDGPYHQAPPALTWVSNRQRADDLTGSKNELSYRGSCND